MISLNSRVFDSLLTLKSDLTVLKPEGLVDSDSMAIYGSHIITLS